MIIIMIYRKKRHSISTGRILRIAACEVEPAEFNTQNDCLNIYIRERFRDDAAVEFRKYKSLDVDGQAKFY